MPPRGRTSVSRIIGIDLGTTNSLVAYVDEATGPPRGHRLFGQAAHGPWVRGRQGRGALSAVPHPAWRRVGEAGGRRPRSHAARGLGGRAQGAEAARGAPLRRARRQGRGHRARLLQRCPATGHEGREPDRGCVDLARDPEAMQELRLAAEAAKIRLSTDERTTLTIPFAGFTYRRAITRAELERLVEPLVRRTLGPARRALADAGLEPKDIDQVVLVGGSTRVPLVRRRVQELFGKTPHSQLNPDEVVALGAAVQAHILAGGITDMLLLDVTPLSLGIETLGGIVSVLISRNTTIPTMAKEYFTTSVDGQTAVDMHVLQGERELAKDNRSLARFDLSGIDPMPAGMPKIEVTFLIDANGMLQVQARELRTGKAASIEVKPTYGLTETQVEQMVEDSYTYAEDDVNARLLIETRTEAETVMNHVRRALAQGGHLMSAEERSLITGALDALRAVEESGDRDAIRERTTELNRATEPLAQLMMDTALREAVTSRRADDILKRP